MRCARALVKAQRRPPPSPLRVSVLRGVSTGKFSDDVPGTAPPQGNTDTNPGSVALRATTLATAAPTFAGAPGSDCTASSTTCRAPRRPA